MSKIGFIGMGNMAGAIADGFIRTGVFKKDEVSAYAPGAEKLERNAERIGFVPVHSLKELTVNSETIIMACKPYQIEGVLDETAALMKGRALISIALGWDHDRYVKEFSQRGVRVSADDDGVRIQFVMPNTPAQIGEGIFLFEETSSLKPDERMCLMEAFSGLGTVKELPTGLMGIGGAITGCGPAFVDMYIEAMADSAVRYGIPRALAYELVSATVSGSAKLQLATGLHPGALKDAVCSPGGSTIRGVCALEKAGFRDACMEAVDAVMNS